MAPIPLSWQAGALLGVAGDPEVGQDIAGEHFLSHSGGAWSYRVLLQTITHQRFTAHSSLLFMLVQCMECFSANSG